MRTTIVVSLTLTLLLVSVLIVPASPKDRFATLEESLIKQDASLELRLGKDFSDPAGSIIFMSKNEGTEIMVGSARKGEPEFSMLYLPRRKAWITITKSRELYKTICDHRYVDAALESEKGFVEIWHTHNNKSEQKDLNFFQHEILSRMWIMPSDTDFIQLHAYSGDTSRAKPVGVVANIYGVTTYWSDDSTFGLAIYQKSFVTLESNQLRGWAEVTYLSNMHIVARSHRGFIKLRFKTVRWR